MSPIKTLFLLLGTFGFLCLAILAAPPQAPEDFKTLDVPTLERQLNPAGAITVNEGVRKNLATYLTRISNSSGSGSRNVSEAASILVRHVVGEAFNIGSVATYIPRLFFLDGPNQFIELLKLYRSNQLKVPQDVDSAIDTLITYSAATKESQIGTNFYPIVEAFPNLFAGVEIFVQDLLYNVFNWLSPLPAANKVDETIKNQTIRLKSTTEAAVETVIIVQNAEPGFVDFKAGAQPVAQLPTGDSGIVQPVFVEQPKPVLVNQPQSAFQQVNPVVVAPVAAVDFETTPEPDGEDNEDEDGEDRSSVAPVTPSRTVASAVPPQATLPPVVPEVTTESSGEDSEGEDNDS